MIKSLIEIIQEEQAIGEVIKEYEKLKEDAGLTSSGKIIPSSNSTLYNKDVSKPINKMANHIQKTFPHYNRRDHDEAAKHHSAEASKALSNNDFDGFSKASEKAAAHRHVSNKMFNKEIEKDKKSHAQFMKSLDKAAEKKKEKKVLATFPKK